MTMSMGIAYGNNSMEKIGEVAQNNLDMALARGGDQVVIKDADSRAKPQFLVAKQKVRFIVREYVRVL
ncbi:hypothetical protein GCM10025857_46890 [Alicyclobacillus contaminans]|nr:hypothetical protein GCM10025857_46890 [Alicyclobacillus contaminans]